MRIIFFAGIVFLSLICFDAKAQSVYYFKYLVKEGNGSVLYQAFFERDLDGTGFIRVRYTDSETNQDVLIDMITEDNYYMDERGVSDSNILYFPGHSKEVIIGDKNIKYIPQIIWFKQNETTGYYEPWGVTSQDDNLDAEGTFTDARLLEAKDLTKELVSTFFTSEEGLYENLFDTASVRGPLPFEKSVKLHLVIVANTEDRTIGTTCVKDKDQTLNTFTDITEYLNMQLVPNTISGKDYSKKAVEQALFDLQPAPDDIVVFYYSGHGFSNTNDSKKYPYLDLRSKTSEPLNNNNLNIEDIYNSIRKKGARLNIVFSDCCNADPNASSTLSSNIAQTRGTSMGWSRENCNALFMNQKPFSLLMTAANKGELSAGNNDVGGIFTFNFRESIESHFGLFYKNVNWSDVLEQAKKQTVTRVSQSVCPQADGVTYKPCVQHPFYRID